MIEQIVGIITVNGRKLYVDNQNPCAQFSANLTYSVEFADNFWEDFSAIEFYASNSLYGSSELCYFDREDGKLVLPYGSFDDDGNLYLTLRGLKYDTSGEKVMLTSELLTLNISKAVNIGSVEDVPDPSWEDRVDSVVEQIANEKVEDGRFIPAFTIGTVTTGEVGSEAKVTISGSKENPVLNFVLPAGGFNLDKVYPVGSVYLSMSKTNPGTIFGGSWMQIAKGRTIVGLDTGDADFASIGKMAGEKSHRLTVNELPSHTHTGSTDGGDGNHNHNAQTAEASLEGTFTAFRGTTGGIVSSVGASESKVGGTGTTRENLKISADHQHQINISNSGAHIHDFTTEPAGGSKPIDILPPYIVVSIWQRTA